MKKIITSLSSALLILVASLSLTGVAKSAEFFTIGTGGPTGVYFQTGNAICKMGIEMINLGMKSQVMIPLREKESLLRMTSKREFNYLRFEVRLIGLVDSVVI